MSRARRTPGQAYKVTPEVLLAALSRDKWERLFGGEQAGRAAWKALEHHPGFVANMTRRLAPFWAYCPDVPDDLRGSGTIEDSGDDALDLARCRWLLEVGAAYQRPGETAALRRMIERLENPRGILPS